MNVQTHWPSLEGLGRHPALETLAGGRPDAEAVDAFVTGHEFPLAEPGILTFAWRGEAEHVHLVRWIHGGGSRLPFARLGGTDLWLLRLPVEDGGRFEYKLGIGRGGGAGEPGGGAGGSGGPRGGRGERVRRRARVPRRCSGGVGRRRRQAQVGEVRTQSDAGGGEARRADVGGIMSTT
jgi:hypothetical protein